MATPTLSAHRLAGALGTLFMDVRAAGRTSPRPAVVILHGFKGFKDWGMFPPFAERLARAGFSAIAFNTSGSGVDEHGEPVLPDRFARDTYSAALHDLGAVVNALAAGRAGVAPPTSIGLVGHSRGGGITILHAARDERVASLVTWAAISDTDRWPADVKRTWRERGTLDVVNSRTGQVIPITTDILDDLERNAGELDIRRAAAEMRVPWLIIHGTDDDAIPFAEAAALHRASGRQTTRLLAIDGAGHTFGAAHPWNPPRPDTERVFDATVEHFAASLR